MDIKVDEQLSIIENSIYRDTRSFTSDPTDSMNPPKDPLPSDPQVMHKLENYYTSYVGSLAKVSELKIKDLQASFEDYLRLAGNALNEPSFTDHLQPANDSTEILRKRFQNESTSVSDPPCSKLNLPVNNHKMTIQKYKIGCLDSHNELQQRMMQGELHTDFYTYYIILNKIWSSEYIRKSDVKELQPCKVILLRSIVKRKFDEELAIRLTYK